ncbi:MAG: PD-(D/E)XK nuclease family protein [Sandaracinaceae bacterium]
MVEPLPPRLEEIEIPHHFHPSSFTALERCALSVLGERAARRPRDLLVLHPTAYLGLVLHHVRAEVSAGRWGAARSAEEAADSVMQSSLRRMEEDLAATGITDALVPLRAAVGRQEWKRRTRTLRNWAAGFQGEGSGGSPRLFSLHPETGAEPADVDTLGDTGVEQTVVVDELRLSGRPDLSYETDQTLEIVEYKSGKLFDSDGVLLEAHRVQVQLYALMLEAVSAPGKALRLYVEQVKRHRVPWSEIHRLALLDRLALVNDALPPGEVRDAATLANPGTHCRNCRLRPVCGKYLDTVPQWWRGGEAHTRPLPLDVWGELAQLTEEKDRHTLRLLDPVGRRVRVDQVSRRHGTGDLRPGQSVWLFNLEASEDLRRHGEQRHPRNFHEYSPGPRWQTARGLRLFGSPPSPAANATIPTRGAGQ